MNAPLTAKDFTSDQDVRWCPGCGDYAILKAVRTVLASVGRAPDDVVFVSGIGCAARFPYYIATYGFHTIHGRAPAVATGIKLANPDLDVWIVGGDGDFLSIGGNHLLHAFRRDIDLTMLLLNNQIYGLTKGQYSPTSAVGTRSPSSPNGSRETPINAMNFALGAGATFIARAVNSMQDHLPGVIERAHDHRGTAIVEILQNCIVYNDGVFNSLETKSKAAMASVRAVHGEPLLFGNDNDRGLIYLAEEGRFCVGVIGEDCLPGDIARHDETNRLRAAALASLTGPDLPTAIGVLYAQARSMDLPARSRPEAMQRDDLAALLIETGA